MPPSVKFPQARKQRAKRGSLSPRLVIKIRKRVGSPRNNPRNPTYANR